VAEELKNNSEIMPFFYRAILKFLYFTVSGFVKLKTLNYSFCGFVKNVLFFLFVKNYGRLWISLALIIAIFYNLCKTRNTKIR
jgi:phosphotransferase system  glucose/maltose/N-acetylglucosamine-specific IIC component